MAVAASSAGCSNPCDNKVAEKNDECGMTLSYDRDTCGVAEETCVAYCVDAYACDDESSVQECIDACDENYGVE